MQGIEEEKVRKKRGEGTGRGKENEAEEVKEEEEIEEEEEEARALAGSLEEPQEKNCSPNLPATARGQPTHSLKRIKHHLLPYCEQMRRPWAT